jgi:hypothetical protein
MGMATLLRQLALVSESSQVKTSELLRVAAALQKQASRDLAPIWDVSATVDAFETLEDVPLGYWPMIIMDDIGFDGAAGIHLDKDNQPFSLITSSSDLDTWSLTASHEELEMLVDPFGNRLVAGDSPKADQDRVEFLVEVADPSEDAEFAYTVNGILVSDFYTPRFFDPIVCSGVRYSFTGAITEPRQVLRGGYLSWHDPVSDDWWQEIWFSGSAPSFRNLGPLEAKGESLRSQIDRRTQSETAKALAKGRSVAAAAGLMAAASQQARTSKADHWHEQIGEILGRRDRATAAGKGRRAGATEQPRRSTTRSGIRSAGRVRPGD